LTLDLFDSSSQQQWEDRYRQYLEGLTSELGQFRDKRRADQKLQQLFQISSTNTASEATRLRQIFTTLWSTNNQAQIDLALSQGEALMTDRDNNWETMIRALYHPGTDMICTTGGLHALDSSRFRPLYTRLKDLKPIRALI
jgi:hypothetical protein